MAIQSNYFRMTPQIMLEYRSDQFNILNSDFSSDIQPSRCYIYKGLDNTLYYTEEPRYTDPKSPDYYKNQSLYIKYPDEGNSQYKYFGMDYPVSVAMDSESNKHIQHSLWLSKENDPLADIQLKSLNLYYDTIRIYFIRGFLLNGDTGLDGITIRVKTEAHKDVVDRDRKWKEPADVCVLDFFLDANDFPKVVKRMSTPLYMNCKYYDQYIDVEFPSPYAVAIADNSSDANTEYLFWELNDTDPNNVHYDIYTLNQNANTLIEFATVSRDNTTVEKEEVVLGRPEIDVTTFTLDPVDTASYLPDSNSNFFNVKIYEDSVENCIVYYPTYGDSENQQEIDTTIMSMINSGEIPITANAFYDLENADVELNDIDFGEDELYYYDKNKEQTSKWKVYNDIVVSYLYGGVTGNEYAYNESYSRIVDYGNDINSSIRFWRTRFVPNSYVITSLNVKNIAIRYTCRLVNVMRGIEVIRVASLTVDALKYVTNVNNRLNIKQYKIVNKLGTGVTVAASPQEVIKEKYIRSYYNATNLVAKNVGTGGTAYPQGMMTLYLYKTNNNYMIQLFNLNDENIRIPYDMTGPYKYRIVFPLVDGSQLSISPNSDSAKQNLGIGTLVFYITGEQAAQIMRVPEADRYFAIMTNTRSTSAQDTTLYQGRVYWLA